MKEAESEYYKEQFDLKKNNIKQIWRNLNNVCSLSTKKVNQSINELNDNGKHIADNLLISNVLNKYFATDGESLSKNFHNNSPSSSNSFRKYLDSASNKSMFVHPVSYEELDRLIIDLNTSTSAGPDKYWSQTCENSICLHLCTLAAYF